ncbi:MAG: hypothetical protein R8L07_03360 [Alphaproteobacteria bacterium]|nr:hypothetical protein [Alphaproteobacteria bacterium]
MGDLTVPGEIVVAVGTAFVGLSAFIKWLVGRLLQVVERNTEAMTTLSTELRAGRDKKT